LACPGVLPEDLVKAAVLSSLADETPEGKSIVELAQQSNMRIAMTPKRMPNLSNLLPKPVQAVLILPKVYASVKVLLIPSGICLLAAGNKFPADVEER
jgi:K+-transporting ATPase ATPase B chain